MAVATLDKRSQLLDAAAEALDLPQRLYEDAILKYEDIGAWLASDDSELQPYSPEIYPQGSFRMGTIVRPLLRKNEFDIDLVCQLAIEKDSVSKAELKHLVGNRLKMRADIAEVLSESRRAWTLDLRAQFYMDVLSSIPNGDRPPTGILLPDRDLHHWQKSNPIAYADWFYDRMRVVYDQKKSALAEELRASIEDVPYWTVKTPLQRVVQILKRHRDVHFQNDTENRPVSIIITTLAARSYRNQADIFKALVDVVKMMANFIERRGDKWWVENPVEPDENFAEKWNEYPERRKAFFEWMRKIHDDFVSAGQQPDLRRFAEYLAPSLGRTTVSNALTAVGATSGVLIESVAEKADAVPGLADFRHCQPPLWPLTLQYKAGLQGTVYRSLDSRKRLWELTNRSVPKGVGLRFQVKTNVPQPYEVFWQVVNTGREAAAVGQLRGDFDRDTGNSLGVRWEGTAYAGTHWVEAFVIKNGNCVAKTGQKRVRVRG